MRAQSSPLAIVFEMVALIIAGTVGTIAGLLGKFFELLASLEYISAFGALGLVVALAVMGLVTFFLLKYFATSGKMLIPVFIIGAIVLWILILVAF
jgi:hypothetical protein